MTDLGAVGVPRARVDARAVLLRLVDELAGGDVPQPQPAVVAASRDQTLDGVPGRGWKGVGEAPGEGGERAGGTHRPLG